ncbi:MAG: type II secretion system protein [Lachnospiraceae bacterium]|nr:type II secretion system protein [Lachnospiraceae bacterium]
MITKKNNKGFTLVEVIVSMLVLSIVISSVLTAFSLSAKANAKTKKVQSAESLMEDLLELASAVKDSSEYADKVAGLFGGSRGASTWEDSNKVEKCTVSGVNKGSYSYSVEIIRDTEPDEYNSMNTTSVVSFGETGSKSVLINASTNGTLFMPGDAENGYDTMALNEFVEMRNSKIRTDNLALGPTATPAPEIDMNVMTATEYEAAINEIKSKIDRDVYLETVLRPSGKMELLAYFSYEAHSSLVLEDTATRRIEYQFFSSGEFNKAGDTTPGAEKLDRVYLLYSPAEAHWETGITDSSMIYDIRIYDEQALLAADVFVVCQEASATINSDLADKKLNERFGSAPSISVSFAKRGEGVAAKSPARVDLYCPAEITFASGVSNVSTHSHQMIAENEEIRVQELTIAIKDSDGNTVATDVVACLQ